MANGIKLGNLTIDSFKVGSSDCKIYLGDTLLYDGGITPPTPTYQWKQYNEGDTVPSKSFYGVKLGDPSMEEASIEFGDSHSTGIAFGFDINYEYGWYAISLTGEQIDITEYFDETEGCYIIYFSDLGLGAMPINYPVPDGSFEFDVQLYEEAPQWATFSNGDTIPSDLQIYGIKGVVNDLARVFYSVEDGIYVEDAGRNKFNVHVGGFTTECYSEYDILSDTSVEYTFSNIGCSEYYTVSSKTISSMSNDIQLLIYA